MEKCLIFLHLPKAAGTTLHYIIADNYRHEEMIDNFSSPKVEDFGRLSPEQRGRYRVVKGHFSFGIHELVPGPSVYITMLRDPIERAVSAYYHAKRDPLHPQHQRVNAENLSLRGYAETVTRMENCQVRMISGMDPPHGQCTRETLEKARKNLEEAMAVVGLAERFDESVLLYQRLLGWKMPFYSRQNVTSGRPAVSKIDPGDLEVLRQLNALDMELYQHGVKLFERMLARQPATFQAEVEAFKELNLVRGEQKREQQRWEQTLAGYRRRNLPWVFWPGAWKARRERNALRKLFSK